ncbi:hypothetical protein GQ457_07G032080 [Hibiscus cannabinus]
MARKLFAAALWNIHILQYYSRIFRIFRFWNGKHQTAAAGRQEMKHGKKHRAEVAKSLPAWQRKFMCYKALKKRVKLINPVTCYSNGKKRQEMKHGKKHRAEVAKSLLALQRKFMCYKALKKRVKLINPVTCYSNGKKRSTQHMGFARLLGRELDKINTFYMDKEEDYIIMFRELEIRARNSDGNEEMLELQKRILGFHSEMVMLLHYSVINFTGLMKIVKKHKKRAGADSVYSTNMPGVLQQPFFSTDLLYNLIRGCEAILDRLSLPD